jgi:hypothetical protein
MNAGFTLMAAKPTIQLRTFFLVFACAAVGLTCATGLSENNGAGFGWMHIIAPRKKPYYFFLYTSVAVVIAGLAAQIRDLARLKFASSAASRDLHFAWSFAISWRAAITLVLCACAVGQILVAREMIHLSEGILALHSVFPDTLALICMIVMISNSIERWDLKPAAKESMCMAAMAFLAGVLILALILRDTGLITYLVHIATQGIERAQQGRFQRLGTFPDQESEGFRFFWLSEAAAITVVIAAAALLLAMTTRGKRRYEVSCFALYLCAITAAAAFCIWYYTLELRRISPDFAEAGLASSWIDRLSGVFIAAIVITVAAYRSAKARYALPIDGPTVSGANRKLYLHEYTVFILLLLGAPVAHFYDQIRITFNDWNPRLGWQQQMPYKVADYLGWPETYIYLAVLVLGIQLLRRRWKHRGTMPACQLTPIDPRQFARNWAAFALLAAVGLPTLSIFSFAYWLGPWYLYGP